MFDRVGMDTVQEFLGHTRRTMTKKHARVNVDVLSRFSREGVIMDTWLREFSESRSPFMILSQKGRQKMKKTIVMVFWVAAVFMIMGCAETMKEGGWIRPHGTVKDFYRDREECGNEAKKDNPTNEPFELLFSRCMQSKGYYYEENSGWR